MFHNILVPLDGSQLSEKALPLALQIARRSGCWEGFSGIFVSRCASGVSSSSSRRYCSACSVILQLVLMVVRARQVVRDADTLARERWILAAAYAGGVVCVAAQLVNCVWLGVAWPHLATITWYLAVSFIVFVRLVQPEA